MTAWTASLDGAWPLAAAGGLALARPLGVAVVAPGWASAAIGPRMRVMLAAALALVVSPATARWAEPGIEPAGWVALVVVELAIGVGLGLTGALVVAGARQAGELVGFQAGLAPASLLDPESPAVGDAGPDDPLTPFGHLYGLIATVVFLVLDGPLRLVDALAASYRAAPPGLGLDARGGAGFGESLGGLVPDLCGRIGGALGLALGAAAPAGVATLVAGLVLAVLARSAGARPLSGLAWPVRAALGVGFVMLTLGVLGATLAAAWGRWAAGLGGG
jgi:flagellar biosynthetic protein FliR